MNDPQDIRVLLQEGVSRHQTGQLPEAETVYRRILDLEPDHADANHMLGVIALQAGNHDLAVQLITKAIRTNPRAAAYHCNLGNALDEQGLFEEAAASQRKAIDLNPEYAMAHNNLGNAEKALGKLDDAVASYRKAIAIKPEYPEALSNLGLALIELGRLDDAIASFRDALALAPDYAEAHSNLGNALVDQGLLDQAVASHRKAVELKPDFAKAHSNLGAALKEAGKQEEAITCYREALRIDPTLHGTHMSLGAALQEQGLLEDAIASYQEAVALDPVYPELHNDLGLAHQALGRLEDAVGSYHEALAIRPDFAQTWNNLKFAAKALRFTKGKDGYDLKELDAAARATPDYALMQYYLDGFRPDQADSAFDAAIRALPDKAEETLTIDGSDQRPVTPPPFANGIVALLHFGRSGTGLLHSLIDGHPEISTLPSIYLRGYFNAGVWERLSADGWRGLPQRFVREFEVLFDAASPAPTPGNLGEDSSFLGEKEGMTNVGDTRDEVLCVDREVFCAEALRLLEALNQVDPGSFLMVVHAAYEKAVGTKTEKHTVFYHIHNPDDYAKLNFLKHVPEARLLMMVREPVESCESWARFPFQDGDYDNMAHRILAMLFAPDQVAFRRHASISVRLEDIKARPEATLKGLCAWMGVQDSPTLYEMTAQGKKWWGDPSSPGYDGKTAMQPFAGPPGRPPGGIFGKRDRRVLETLFYPFAVRFGYRAADPAWLKRNLKELPELLEGLLDFETALAGRIDMDPEQFMRSGSCQLLRAGIEDRRRVLDERGNYSGMLTALEIPTE